MNRATPLILALLLALTLGVVWLMTRVARTETMDQNLVLIAASLLLAALAGGASFVIGHSRRRDRGD